MEEHRVDFEQMLMEADRIMMQIVQTSLSLIGFGFTINTFFNGVADAVQVTRAAATARVLWLALLAIGLLLLGLGTWNQRRYRGELIRRYATVDGVVIPGSALQARFSPSYVSALLLLIVGLCALGSALLRWLL